MSELQFVGVVFLLLAIRLLVYRHIEALSRRGLRQAVRDENSST